MSETDNKGIDNTENGRMHAFTLGVEHGEKGHEPAHQDHHDYMMGHKVGSSNRKLWPSLYEDHGEHIDHNYDYTPSVNHKVEIIGKDLKHTGKYGYVVNTHSDNKYATVKSTDGEDLGIYHASDLYHVKEEVNTAGSGAIAGIGVGSDGEPGVKQSKYQAVNVLMAKMYKRLKPNNVS